MRRLCSAVLTIILLFFLVGCSRQDENEKTALALRAAVAEASGCRMVLDVNANCDGRLYAFRLGYEDNGSERTIEVLSPDTIAGVRAGVNDTLQLEFEEVVLDFGMPEGALTTPLLAPHLLAQCMKASYIAYTSDSEQGTAVRYYHGYEQARLEVQLIIDRASLRPLSCEIFQDGQVILSAAVTDFELYHT